MKVEKVRFVWICDESFWVWFYVTSVHPKIIMKILLHQERKVILLGNERKFKKVQTSKSEVREENYRLVSVSSRDVLEIQEVYFALCEKVQ